MSRLRYYRDWAWSSRDAPSTEECNNRTDSTHNRTKAKENIAHAGSAQIRTEDHDKPASKDEQSQHRNDDKNTGSLDGKASRKRLTQKTNKAIDSCNVREVRSYARAWMKYIDGNVVSRMSHRFITNLLTATAARVVEEPADSSEDSDEFHYDHLGELAGSMDLIQQTLDGINARDKDNGVEAIGRHAKVIQLGRIAWQSPPLSEAETRKRTSV